MSTDSDVDAGYYDDNRLCTGAVFDVEGNVIPCEATNPDQFREMAKSIAIERKQITVIETFGGLVAFHPDGTTSKLDKYEGDQIDETVGY